MRVIGGELKKRKLVAPGKLEIRPTPDRVREALFSSLGEDVSGSIFLDLFSGTGAVGIEAVSRGASRVRLVEKDRRSMALIMRNISLCKISEERAQVQRNDALNVVKSLFLKEEKFDYIFLDPPYHTDLAEQAVRLLNDFPILTPSGKIVVEHYFKKELPEKTELYTLIKKIRYGDTVLSYYIYSANRSKFRVERA